MLSSLTNPNLLLGGLVLALLQCLAALPWIRAIDSRSFDKSVRNPQSVLYFLGVVLFLGFALTSLVGFRGDADAMPRYGRFYGSVLHLQLLIDLFLFVPWLLTVIAPKTGAVALAAYREGWRQPMFWLILFFGFMLTWVAVVLPYYTFGDDFKMMKQIGFDLIMISSLLFGLLAASISIADEIEGRTAITVMSKPINRRQFFIGKFLGVLMACGAMGLLLCWNLNFALWVMPEFDKINEDRAFDPMPMQAKTFTVPAFRAVVPPSPMSSIAGGAGQWFGEIAAHSIGLVLCFGQVTILLAICTALATRLPFVVNLVLCLFVYFLGHLAPVIVKVTDRLSDQGTATALIRFFGNLFDTILPALEFFTNGPAIVRENPLTLGEFSISVASTSGYALIYTAIALIVGLLLFEDRDLA
jgi:hypothetical protein